MQGDEDIDGWADSVAGRRAAGGDHAAEAVRRAVRAEDAAASATGAQDAVGLARLVRRLETEGLLGSKARPARRLSRPWLALAAAAGVAAIAITVQFAIPGRDAGPQGRAQPPVETSRGFAGAVKLTVADPETEATRVLAELAALGFAPRRVPRADRVIIEVDVSAASLEGFRAWAEPQGARAAAPGTWRVIIDRTAP
jgi:hypothetical protein